MTEVKRVDLVAERASLTDRLAFVNHSEDNEQAPYICFIDDGHVVAQINTAKIEGDKIVNAFGNDWPDLLIEPLVGIYGHLLAAAPELLEALTAAQACFDARVIDGSATWDERKAQHAAKLAIEAAWKGTVVAPAVDVPVMTMEHNPTQYVINEDDENQPRLPHVSADPDVNWQNDAIQFPRLLAELYAVSNFTEDEMIELYQSMDLTEAQVASLFQRAQAVWDAIKAKTPAPAADVDVCPRCGSRNTNKLDGTTHECHDCGQTYTPAPVVAPAVAEAPAAVDPNAPMKRWKIDAGNSATGPCGYVVYDLLARTKEEALEKARKTYAVPDVYEDNHGEDSDGNQTIINIYLNTAALTLDDIELDADHEHTCAACGHVWECDGDEDYCDEQCPSCGNTEQEGA